MGEERSEGRHSREGSSGPGLAGQEREDRAVLHSSSPQARLWAWAGLGWAGLLEFLGARQTDLERLTT